MSDQPTFEEEIERLDAIVRRLESQGLDLDESLRLFEEGVAGLRVIRERLAAAEARVRQVLGDEPGR